MKKNLLLSVLSIVFATMGFSQSLSLHLEQEIGEVTNDQVINFYVDPDIGFVAIDGEVTNNADRIINSMLKKVYIDVIPESNNYFCWGSCFPENVFVSPYAEVLSPGQTKPGFSLDYNANGVVGTSTIRYTLFDMDDLNDSLSIIVNFNSDNSAVGLDEIHGILTDFSQVYPNPASSSAKIDYAFTNNVSEAKLILRSILGSKVKELHLNELQGTAVIDTKDLTEGIYFCSLVVNGEIAQTRKLIVNR